MKPEDKTTVGAGACGGGGEGGGADVETAGRVKGARLTVLFDETDESDVETVDVFEPEEEEDEWICCTDETAIGGSLTM
jgi:hypothetical protein